MSLNWNLEGIENREEVCWVTATEDQPTRGIKAGDRVMNGATEALIFGTMGVGIGDLNETTAPEFYARIKVLEDLWGHFLYNQDGPIELTMEDIRAHIGLRTNVFPQETRAKWIKRIVGGELDDHVRAYERTLEAVDA